MSDKLYNLAQLEELAGGNDDFVNSMVETFLEHTPEQLNEMLEAYKAGELETLGAIAHKIKPNIDLFEIQNIKEDIRTVEDLGKNNLNNPQLQDSLGNVELTLREVFKQLDER